MFGLGVGELVVIFAILLLLFGGRQLPEIASGLGQAIRNFKQGLREGETESGLNRPSSTLPSTSGNAKDSSAVSSSSDKG